MASNLRLFQALLLAISSLYSSRVGAVVGVNWGTTASHPLSPPKVVELLKSNNITKVKLFDVDPNVLQSLSGSNIYVTVGIPNSMLRTLNSSKKAADSWVHDNLTRYFSDARTGVRIEYIAVGDEPFLQIYGDQFHPFVVGAAINIQIALTSANLANKVRVVVPCSSDTFKSESILPSKGHFRPDINQTMIELLTFLNKHHSPFFANILPFLTYHQNKNISLDFTLFKKTAHPLNDTDKTYENSFDLTYDTLITSLSTAGFPEMEIVVGQIGWPTDGAVNATSSTAETFMKGFMEHVHSKAGTPLRPRNFRTEIYLFSLLDEDQRSLVTGNFQRHWGIFTFDGQAKYPVDFGQGFKNLVNAQNVEYLASKWCVLNNNMDLSNASASAMDACSVADCSAMSPGGSCFNITWPGNISYAFNSYYQQQKQTANSCDFGGLGLITTVDPSLENCRFLVGLQTSLSCSLHLSFLVYWILLITAAFPFLYVCGVHIV